MRRRPPLRKNTTLNVAFKTRIKTFDIEFQKTVKTQNLGRLTALFTVARLEAKQSSIWSLFYFTTTNSPAECAFWGSDECVSPLHVVFHFISIRLFFFFMPQKHFMYLVQHATTWFKLLHYCRGCTGYSKIEQFNITAWMYKYWVLQFFRKYQNTVCANSC